MHLRIEHTLSYQYSPPITLDMQIIRLRPRPDTRQQVLNFDLAITPSPSFITHHTDTENNALVTAWFKGTQEELCISANSEVVTENRNPFDFIITESAMNHLPLVYQEPARTSLSLYTTNRRKNNQILNDFLKLILVQAKYETVQFLSELVTYISKTFKKVDRKYGNPWSPEKTIKEGKGACRDLAWLYIVSCRSLGLATRFVSGYYLPFNPRKKPELHAWCEVFLPGAGWLGLDPNLGMAVSERHVAIATSYDPVMTLPTSGIFWGKGTKSELKTSIVMRLMK
jgi:transglutaminase-like putative cysteine protease